MGNVHGKFLIQGEHGILKPETFKAYRWSCLMATLLFSKTTYFPSLSGVWESATN